MGTLCAQLLLQFYAGSSNKQRFRKKSTYKYVCCENRGADQLHGDLCLYFVHTCMQKAGFLMMKLILVLPLGRIVRSEPGMQSKISLLLEE